MENFYPSPIVEIRSAVLKRFMETVVTIISQELGQQFAERPEVTYAYAQTLAHDIILQVRQPVWGQTLDTITITEPASWWQMLKRDHAPKWFLKRYPVKVVVLKRYEVRADYPELIYPGKEHRVTVVKEAFDNGIRPCYRDNS